MCSLCVVYRKEYGRQYLFVAGDVFLDWHPTTWRSPTWVVGERPEFVKINVGPPDRQKPGEVQCFDCLHYDHSHPYLESHCQPALFLEWSWIHVVSIVVNPGLPSLDRRYAWLYSTHNCTVQSKAVVHDALRADCGRTSRWCYGWFRGARLLVKQGRLLLPFF